jgi:hypothetical protein
MVIRKVGRSYQVRSKAGKRLGTHATRASAARQLRAIEASKHRRGK